MKTPELQTRVEGHSLRAVVMPRREDCAIETMRCDKCNCLLASIERDEARDTGFQECRDCVMERHNAASERQPTEDVQ